MVGRRAEQHDLALAVGATHFTTDDDEASNADLVIEAAGATSAVETSIRAARRGGTVLLLGLPPTGRTVELPADLLVNNDLTLSASFGYTSTAWAGVVELLIAGQIAPGRIVTHRYSLDQFEDAFAVLATSSGARGKVLLEIAGETAD